MDYKKLAWQWVYESIEDERNREFLQYDDDGYYFGPSERLEELFELVKDLCDNDEGGEIPDCSLPF